MYNNFNSLCMSLICVLSANKIILTFDNYIPFVSAPVFMPTPVVYTLNSSFVNITWMTPTNDEANGVIVKFSIYRQLLWTNPAAPPVLYEVSIDVYSREPVVNFKRSPVLNRTCSNYVRHFLYRVSLHYLG